MKGKLLLSFIFLPILLSAQLSVSVDALPDSIKFGDQVVLNYKLNVPANVDLTSLDFSILKEVPNAAYSVDSTMFDEFMDIDIVDGGVYGISDNNLTVTKPNNGKDIPRTGSVTLRISSVGAFSLPVPKLGHFSGEIPVPLRQKNLFVLPIGEMLEINENKSIIEEEVSWKDYLIYLYMLLGAAGLLLLGLFISKKLKKKEVEESVEEVIVKRPAHIIALESLNGLKEKSLWQQGEEKEYHSELTRIMRQYIEDRFDVQALEMTTSQLKRDMDSKSIEKSLITRVINILQISDKVKFAKGKTGPEINEQFMQDSYNIVNETKQITEIGEEL